MDRMQTVGAEFMSGIQLRQKGALSQSKATGTKGKAEITLVRELDRLEGLRATKEMILREAEYVLDVLGKDGAFWDDIAAEYMLCPRCGEQFSSQAVYLSLVSPDGYMSSDEAKRFLCGEGCPSCRPDLFRFPLFE